MFWMKTFTVLTCVGHVNTVKGETTLILGFHLWTFKAIQSEKMWEIWRNQEVDHNQTELWIKCRVAEDENPPPTLQRSYGSSYSLSQSPPFLQTQTGSAIMEGGTCCFFPLSLFFPLKEVSFLVFPKREQQQGNEGASPLSRSRPSTSQFFGLPYKSSAGKWVQAVGSFLLGSGGLWTDARILPQTPLYEWSVAERENIPNFFFLSCLKESTCLVASRHVQLCGFAAGAAAQRHGAPGQGAGRGRP